MAYRTIILLLLSQLTFNAIAANKPEGLSATEWQNIQSQINNKSLLQTNSVIEQNYLKASNVDANTAVADGGDVFGSSVAIDGDTLVVGARFEDGSDDGTENNSGAAYVFVRVNGVWAEQAYLRASNPSNGDQFGYSVDISRDTIVVGAHLEDTNGFNSGAVYVFTRTLETWVFQTMIKASNPGSNDNFGFSVSLDLGTLLVGAHKEDGDDSSTLNDYGAAYVLTGSGSSWSEQAILSADNFGTGDNFGYSVSLSGDTAVIGAYNEDGVDDGNEDDSGAAYVFFRSGTSWSQQAYLKASNLGANDNFGVSVGISNDTLIIGAFGEDGASDNLLNSGAVYAFTRTGIIWSEQTILRANNAGLGDLFGTSVAIDNDRIVVGAKFEDGDGIDGLDNNNAFNSGAAYLFIRTGSMPEQSYLKASNADVRDEFGITVAVSGNTVIVGAPSEDSAVINDPNDTTFISNTPPFISGAGAGYVFSPPDLMFTDGFE